MTRTPAGVKTGDHPGPRACIEQGPLIDAGRNDLAERVFASLKSHPYFADNPPVRKGTAIGQKKLEPIMLNIIAAEIFKFRDREIWPCFVFEEDDEDDEEEEEVAADGPPRGEKNFQGRGRSFFASDATRVD